MFARLGEMRRNINPLLWNGQTSCKMYSLMVLNFLDAGVKAVTPYIFSLAMTQLTERKKEDAETFPLIITSAFAMAWAVGQITPTLRKKLTTQIKSSLSIDLTSKIMRLASQKSLDFVQTTPQGSISQLIMSTFTAGTDYVPSVYQQIIPAALETVASASVIGVLIDWETALAVLGSTLIFAFIAVNGNKGIPQLEEKRVAERKKMAGVITSLLSNYESMHYFNNEEYELTRLRQALEDYKNSWDKVDNSRNNAELYRNIWLGISYMAIFPFTAHQYLHDTLNLHDMVMLVLYLMQMAAPLSGLSTAFNQLETATLELQNCVRFFDQGPDVVEAKNATPLMIAGNTANIVFEGVTLKQADGTIILDDISFEIPAGKRVAFVGVSGSGKTTIGKLLFRFINPNQGKIYIDGKDISQCTIDSVRSSIGIVPQNPVLSNETLEKNVRYGNLSVNDPEMIKNALLLAGLKDDFDTNRLKLDKPLGEGGAQISGGQKQRIAIARLLLKDPPILFLDEATSALDIDNKVAVNQTLNEISNGFTTMIITHDLITVADADQIFVFDNGKIVERGKFDDLLAKGQMIKQGHANKIGDKNEEKAEQKQSLFYNKFKKYCDQLGQTVEEVSKRIPRTQVFKQRHRPFKFFEQKEPTIPNPSLNNEKEPLLNKKDAHIDIDIDDNHSNIALI